MYSHTCMYTHTYIYTSGGIIASLLAILVFAITMPAPGEAGSTHTSSRSHGRTHGR